MDSGWSVDRLTADALSLAALLGGWIGTAFGNLAAWLPAMATFLACVYYAIQAYESETVQRLLRRKP